MNDDMPVEFYQMYEHTEGTEAALYAIAHAIYMLAYQVGQLADKVSKNDK